MPNSLDLARLDTVQVVTPTPFTRDGSRVVPEILKQHTHNLVAAGIRVFIPAAGTGEFHSLSADEIIQCVESTRIAAGNESLVIAPTGLAIPFAVNIGCRAADVGADALLVMSPVHPYLSDDGFRDYMTSLAAAVPLPLMVYKRGSVPSDALLIELATRQVIIGVKYAANDFSTLHRFTVAAPSNLGIYCGTAERFAPMFALCGVTGFTSGLSNICPKLCLQLHRLLSQRQFDIAMTLLESIRSFEDFRAMENDSLNIPAIKAALSYLGVNFGSPRPPQRHLSGQQQLLLEQITLSLNDAERTKGANLSDKLAYP